MDVREALFRFGRQNIQGGSLHGEGGSISAEGRQHFSGRRQVFIGINLKVVPPGCDKNVVIGRQITRNNASFEPGSATPDAPPDIGGGKVGRRQDSRALCY